MSERAQDQLRIEYRPVDALRPQARNARTHSAAQIRQLVRSVRQFGFTSPVLVDDEGRILAGHGRVAAAKLLGMAEIPTVRLSGMTPAQRRAYVIADNRLAQNAGWDDALLALEVAEIAALEPALDLTLTGLEVAEIDLLLASSRAAQPEPAVKIDPDALVITWPGDLWVLGRHRLLCGDARDAQAHARLMAGGKARVVFVDPPFNVRVADINGLGTVRHVEFAMASGEMSEAAFIAFLVAAFRRLAGSSADGSIHFVCMDWRHLGELLAAGKAVYSELKNLCVWTKTNAGMGSLYRSQHELVAVFKAGTAAHVNTVELGRHGRYRTNVWSYAGANTFRAGRLEDLRVHPTVKPVELVADAICDVSRRGDIVLDSFLGSGTTLLAAERVGRVARGMEIEPRYVDAAIRRWQAVTGEDAVHAVSGRSFTELEGQAAGAIRADDPDWMR